MQIMVTMGQLFRAIRLEKHRALATNADGYAAVGRAGPSSIAALLEKMCIVLVF